MDYKVLTILAAILIIGIAAIRRRLVFELQAASLLITKKTTAGIVVYAILFWPGTVVHELSHWLMAEILLVKTGKIELMPDKGMSQEGEQRLGSVMTAQSGPFRTFLIGFAPFITGILTLIGLGYMLEILWGTGSWWQIALVLYGLITTGNSMLVSREDRRNWPLIAIVAIIVAYAMYRLGIALPSSVVVTYELVLMRINQALGLTIGLNLGMIALSYVIRRGLESVTKQRITMRR